MRKPSLPGCTRIRQRAVNGLHSLDFREDKRGEFLIDGNFKKRKRILVLGRVLEFCRLVRRPGLKQDHLHFARGEGRSARVYSKALVEENKGREPKAR